MKRKTCALPSMLLAFLAVLVQAGAGIAGESPGWRGPVAAAATEKQVLVAELDGQALAILDAQSGALQNRVALPGPANGVCTGPDGLALLACGVRDGSLCLVNTKKAKVKGIIPLGHT